MRSPTVSSLSICRLEPIALSDDHSTISHRPPSATPSANVMIAIPA
jgi:hypothetical protein